MRPPFLQISQSSLCLFFVCFLYLFCGGGCVSECFLQNLVPYYFLIKSERLSLTSKTHSPPSSPASSVFQQLRLVSISNHLTFDSFLFTSGPLILLIQSASCPVREDQLHVTVSAMTTPALWLPVILAAVEVVPMAAFTGTPLWVLISLQGYSAG